MLLEQEYHTNSTDKAKTNSMFSNPTHGDSEQIGLVGKSTSSNESLGSVDVRRGMVIPRRHAVFSSSVRCNVLVHRTRPRGYKVHRHESLRSGRH